MHTQRRNEIVMAILDNRIPADMTGEETLYYKAMIHRFYEMTTDDHCDYSDGHYTVNRIETERLKRLVGFYNYTSAIRRFVLLVGGGRGKPGEIARAVAWKDRLYNGYMDAVLDRGYRKRFEACIVPLIGEQHKMVRFANGPREEDTVNKEEFWLKGQPARYMVHQTNRTRVHLSSLDIFFIRLYKLLVISDRLIKLSRPTSHILLTITQNIVVPFEARIFLDYDRLMRIEAELIPLIVESTESSSGDQ